jgi:beta-1,4-mannosyltransferase
MLRAGVVLLHLAAACLPERARAAVLFVAALALVVLNATRPYVALLLAALTAWRFAAALLPRRGRAQRVAVVVLGDVGRSPRMQYHCVSLDRRGARVCLIGTEGEACVPEVQRAPGISVVGLVADPFSGRCHKSLFLVYAPLKAVFQAAQLLATLLFRIPHPDAILLQIPPSVPTVGVVILAALVRPSRVVFDWHNFGYTILALSKGLGHPFVRLMKAGERVGGRFADGNLCVTNAMQDWLRANWGIAASPLHDCPPAFFKRLDARERHAFFRRTHASLFAAAAAKFSIDVTADGAPNGAAEGDASTLFTLADGSPRKDRPALLVSSTSWTPDEDFGLLYDALVAMDGALGASGPNFLVIVTGKGPMKAAFERKLARAPMAHILVQTAWLSTEDYAALLGAADAGVCLHTSSSGLDLPMKVVDMYGAGLPVFAVHFSCIDELVHHGVSAPPPPPPLATWDQPRLPSIHSPARTTAPSRAHTRPRLRTPPRTRPHIRPHARHRARPHAQAKTVSCSVQAKSSRAKCARSLPRFLAPRRCWMRSGEAS